MSLLEKHSKTEHEEIQGCMGHIGQVAGQGLPLLAKEESLKDFIEDEIKDISEKVDFFYRKEK
jgi:hypothetical protein